MPSESTPRKSAQGRNIPTLPCPNIPCRAVDIATGPRWLLGLRIPRAITSGAFQFCSNWHLHKIIFPEMNFKSNSPAPAQSPSYCCAVSNWCDRHPNIDGHTTPSRSNYRTKIGRDSLPENAVADVEQSGLVTGHFSCFIPQAGAFI
jgi:hypothetical protein